MRKKGSASLCFTQPIVAPFEDNLRGSYQCAPFLTRGYAKRRNEFLLGLRYANVSLAHSGVESS